MVRGDIESAVKSRIGKVKSHVQRLQSRDSTEPVSRGALVNRMIYPDTDYNIQENLLVQMIVALTHTLSFTHILTLSLAIEPSVSANDNTEEIRKLQDQVTELRALIQEQHENIINRSVAPFIERSVW